MSEWFYINGVITVYPLGRTQAEKRYILETVIEHLPVVSGSEGDMDIHIIQRKDTNVSSTCDEFGQRTENLKDDSGRKYKGRIKYSRMRYQQIYHLLLDGALRDVYFEEGFKMFNKWLNRLAKRVFIDDILVKVKGYTKDKFNEKTYLFDRYKPYHTMEELPRWAQLYHSKGKEKELHYEPNWCEYLMWDKSDVSNSPLLLDYKYYFDEKLDEEMARRFCYEYQHYLGLDKRKE